MPGSIPGSPTISMVINDLGCRLRRWATSVEHNMRLTAYLSASRHGIFYFRYPLPTANHPARKRWHVRISLSTREPRQAAQFARLLAVAGQSVLSRPMVLAMRYDEMRQHVQEHFSQMLRDFRERAATDGPLTEAHLYAFRTAQTQATGTLADWLDLTRYEDETALVRSFCERRGIDEVPQGQKASLLAAELQKGYRKYASLALEHIADFDNLTLEPQIIAAPTTPQPRVQSAVKEADMLALAEVLSRYFAELDRTKALAVKTDGEKRDALALMAELTGSKPPANMTKADVQAVKAALFKLPKNRSKNPKTRDLPLREALEVTGLERIAARTMNVYLGHMQHFFGWAVDNGYAAVNVFQGLRLKRTARSDEEGRKAFSAQELQLMYSHLTDPDSSLVKKDVQKWPALIGMFTGMRLNEVAQLEVQDIELRDAVWCINVTPDGEGNKRLKNASSKRRVPVHHKLVASGFLDFFQAQKSSEHPRLFPELTNSAQNGYGRNSGRWFNERFLPELGLGDGGLVFHCLRHTMITRLVQAGVEEPLVKAIVGHSQTGVTYSTYFKEGFLPAQLSDAINRFDF